MNPYGIGSQYARAWALGAAAYREGLFAASNPYRQPGHFPVGAQGQFVWLDGTKVGT